MKTILTTLFTVLTLNAQAQYIESHEMPNFEACENIQYMAVLNKDNRPYWVMEPADARDVEACYENVKIFVTKATPDMIHLLQREYDGQIRIFDNDVDFSEFVEENSYETASGVFEKAAFNSQISPILPNTAKLFDGVLQ
jgi:hypothetical protein